MQHTEMAPNFDLDMQFYIWYKHATLSEDCPKWTKAKNAHMQLSMPDSKESTQCHGPASVLPRIC